MRCRKVRFYLSAYCHDELGGDKKLNIDEHLANCPACRKEEAVIRSLEKGTKQLDSLKVSEDFNTRLLNRIANERFAETRTKAYQPKSAPILSWSKAIPVLASACVLVLTAIAVFSPFNGNNVQPNYADINKLNDSYLTVQPDMDKNWSLDKQLAKVERMNRISSQLQPSNSFNTGLQMVNSQREHLVPFAQDYYRVRPVVRIYIAPNSNSAKEGTGVY